MASSIYGTCNPKQKIKVTDANEDYEFIQTMDAKTKYLVIGYIKMYNKIIPKLILSKCILYYAYYNPKKNVIFAVGLNLKGQFGTGDEHNISSFTKLKWSIGLSINKIICSWSGCTFITASNDLYVTGWNQFGQLGLNHKMDQLLPKKHPFFANKFKMVNASYSFMPSKCSFYVCGNGSIYGSGGNSFGQLGLGNKRDYLNPQKLKFFNNMNVISATCTQCSSLFLTSHGDVYSCGRNRDFVLGYEANSWFQTTPQKITMLQDVISIQCGMRHSYCLSKNGIIYCFGDNRYGQLGIDKAIFDSNKLSIHKISWFTKYNKFIKTISSGLCHTAAIDTEGNAFVWGKGEHGRIGNGKTSDSFVPVQVNVLKNMKIMNISCGLMHTIALTEKNALYCWGSNEYQECSIDNKNEILLPNEYYQNDYIHSVCAGVRCTLILLNP